VLGSQVMKNLAFRLAVAFSLAVLAGCTTGNTVRRDDDRRSPEDRRSAGEVAGKAAYDIKKGAQKASKEISKELKNFGHDAKAGFQEEKAKDQSRPHRVEPDK
jgi:hypothetical protein